MSVLKRRSRLIYFRVTEEEFSQIMAVCQSAGARSLSALARRAMQRLLAHPDEQASIGDRLKQIEEQMSLLLAKLQLTNEMVEVRSRVAVNSHGALSDSSAPSIEIK